MTIKFIVEKDGVELRSMTLTQAQLQCLKNDLPGDIGVWRWFRGMVEGKINNCAKRLEPEAIKKVRELGLTPAS